MALARQSSSKTAVPTPGPAHSPQDASCASHLGTDTPHSLPLLLCGVGLLSVGTTAPAQIHGPESHPRTQQRWVWLRAICVGYSGSKVGQDKLENYSPAVSSKGRHRSPNDTGFLQQVPKITADIHPFLPSSPTEAHHLSPLFAQFLSRDRTPMACPRSRFPSLC